MEIEKADESIPAKLVFVHNKSELKNWSVLVNTDTAISEEEIICIYGKNGYKIEYEYLFRDMESMELKNVLKKDIVGFSLYPDTFEFSYECIKCVKDYGDYVIVGGKYATDNYEELLNNIPEIDAICLGHGEFPYLEFLNMLSDGINIEQCFLKIPFFVTRNKRIDQIKICVSDINDPELFIVVG